MKSISKVDPPFYRSGQFGICEFLNILEDGQYSQNVPDYHQLHGKNSG
jgi:hypothetical protein